MKSPSLKHFIIVSTFVLCTGILSSCNGSSSPIADNPPISEDPLILQEILDQTVSGEVKGIFVYIQQQDGTAVVATSGVQDDNNGAVANANALFKIASISKLFIAVATIKLVDNGSLSLDDTLLTWLPTVGERIQNSETITIRHLLQHRSGIPDFDSQTGFSWSNSHTSIDQTLERALDLPADFMPNERYEYSNTNYLLLGKILDIALGYSHRVYIQDVILTPNQLFDTYSLLEEIDTSMLARGYWNGNDVTELSYSIPGGSMVSNIQNIGHFIRELATGELLTIEERALYRTTLSSFGHSGWLPGYQSIARYYPAIDAVVIQFVNTTGGNSESLSNANFEKLLQWISQQNR